MIGIHRTTLHAWWKSGKVTPDWITPGGQARWNVERLKRQLGIMSHRDEGPRP